MRYRARRVIVKARVVKLKGAESQAIAAHLRYLQREGVTLDGERGQPYSRCDDQVDTKAFVDRSIEDRHQFRFIVAAEDGVALGDLKPFTRRLLAQMEQDLETTLDWVAVDHYNTGQPHTHVVLRGITEQGKILYIAGDYIAHGIRARASDLVTRELGRQNELELQDKLGREVDHDRFTRLDRTLLEEAKEGRVDLRISPDQSYLVRANRHLLIARLAKLEGMHLAKPVEPAVWELSPNLSPVLTELGERIDALNLMRDALGQEAAHRSLSTFRIHHQPPRFPITGQLIGSDLVGEGLSNKPYVIIHGIDAQVHYGELSLRLVPEQMQIGAVLTVGRQASARTVDNTIAAFATGNDGFYEPREHYKVARMAERIPGGDLEGHIEAHVRRLEALRRAGLVDRLDEGLWRIPPDFLDRAAAYDERAGRRAVLELHSNIALEKQITAEAATWLDRQLVGRHRIETAPAGFGHKVREALEQRKRMLVTAGLANRLEDGRLQVQPDLLATLQDRELDKVGQHFAKKHGLTYLPARDGELVRGTYRGTLLVASGKFAVIQHELHFTLVPWRDILERFRGREVVGLVRGMGVSWQLGQQRSRGLSR